VLCNSNVCVRHGAWVWKIRNKYRFISGKFTRKATWKISVRRRVIGCLGGWLDLASPGQNVMPRQWTPWFHRTGFLGRHTPLGSVFPPKDGVGLVPKRGCLLTLAYYAFRRWYEFGERRWSDTDRKNEELGEKPVPVSLCPPQIPHGLTRARTRASAVRGRWLTTWAMVRPSPKCWSKTLKQSCKISNM
jgi:hypothetical protein